MSSNLPVKVEKENIFKKLFKFIRHIFRKESNINAEPIKNESINENKSINEDGSINENESINRNESINENESINRNESINENERSVKELYKVENIDSKNAEIIKKENQKRKIEEIIHIIEQQPSSLEKLDIPKLEIIDKYYKDKIAEYKKMLPT